jgi:hypothetical protein
VLALVDLQHALQSVGVGDDGIEAAPFPSWHLLWQLLMRQASIDVCNEMPQVAAFLSAWSCEPGRRDLLRKYCATGQLVSEQGDEATLQIWHGPIFIDYARRRALRSIRDPSGDGSAPARLTTGVEWDSATSHER